MPAEVLKAMDILSIDKKYLKEAGFVKDQLLSDMRYTGVSLAASDMSSRPGFMGDFRTEFIDCSYKISSDAISTSAVNVSYMQREFSAA